MSGWRETSVTRWGGWGGMRGEKERKKIKERVDITNENAIIKSLKVCVSVKQVTQGKMTFEAGGQCLPFQVHNNEENNNSHQCNCSWSYTSNQANLFNCVSLVSYYSCNNNEGARRGPKKREKRELEWRRKEGGGETQANECIAHSWQVTMRRQRKVNEDFTWGSKEIQAGS